MHGQLAEANAFPVAVGEERIVHSGKAHAKKLRALGLPPNSLPLRIVQATAKRSHLVGQRLRLELNEPPARVGLCHGPDEALRRQDPVIR
jgi:hypothetical protein